MTDLLFGSRPRLRRPGGFMDLPETLDDRVQRRRSIDISDLTIRYEVTRWWQIVEAEDEEGDLARRRSLSARICQADRTIGCFRADVYDIAWWASNSSINWALDGDRYQSARLAEVLTGAWEDFGDEVACYGSVVEITHVSVEPGVLRHTAWAQAVETVLKKALRRIALVVTKAFPLEYEGELQEGSPLMAAFRARQTALVRLYKSLGELRPFPGAPGEGGWLWRIPERFAGVIDPPSWNEAWRSNDL